MVVRQERSHGRYLHKAKLLLTFSVFEASVRVEGSVIHDQNFKSTASISRAPRGKVNAA
jgi:hypothetical protein